MSDISIINDTSIEKIANELKSLFADKHEHMISKIVEHDALIVHDTKNFCRSQSQFMDKMLTISHPTPYRNLRQILAEIASAKDALRDAYFKYKKSIIKIKMMERDYNKEQEELERELKLVEIEESKSHLISNTQYVNSTVRRISGYITEYLSILNKLGVNKFDELDFEKHEEEYHIKKVFEQALISARSRGGIVDEGNHIYFYQIGINGAVANAEILAFLQQESDKIIKHSVPDHDSILKFLESMYQKYKGSSQRFADFKGMSSIIDEGSLLIDKEIDKEINESR